MGPGNCADALAGTVQTSFPPGRPRRSRRRRGCRRRRARAQPTASSARVLPSLLVALLEGDGGRSQPGHSVPPRLPACIPSRAAHPMGRARAIRRRICPLHGPCARCAASRRSLHLQRGTRRGRGGGVSTAARRAGRAREVREVREARARRERARGPRVQAARAVEKLAWNFRLRMLLLVCCRSRRCRRRSAAAWKTAAAPA